MIKETNKHAVKRKNEQHRNERDMKLAKKEEGSEGWSIKQ